MTRVLITGAAGFIGRHLATMVAAAGGEVTGVGRRAAAGPWRHFAELDIADAARLREVIASSRPDLVVHAAGWLRGTAHELLAHNAAPVPALCEALHAVQPEARLCVLGSAAEYGEGRRDGEPTGEDWPCAPDRPYGVSKLVATKMALAHGERLGLRVVVARLANVIGPGMSEQLVVGSLVAQLAACRRAGRAFAVQVGELTVQRDFLDVEDACRGVLALARHDRPPRICNLAAGTCHSIAAVIEQLQQVVGAPIAIEPDAQRASLGGPPIVRLSASLAASTLGFRAMVTLPESLARMWQAALASDPLAVRP